MRFLRAHAHQAAGRTGRNGGMQSMWEEAEREATGPHTGSRCPCPPASPCGGHPSGLVCKGRSPLVLLGVPKSHSVGSCCISLVPQMVQNLVALL